jgi:hypothetical protein
MGDDFDCKATASILDSGRVLANAAHAGAVVAGLGCFISLPVAARLFFIFSILCWFAGSWFAVRVAIDASLFRALTGDFELRRLDALLTRWGFTQQPKERNLEDRSHGALRLWRRQTMLLAIQLAALLAGTAVDFAAR